MYSRYTILINYLLLYKLNNKIYIQAADQENEQRRRLEAAAAEALNTSEEVIKRNKLNQKKQQVCRVSLMFYFCIFTVLTPT